jgi:sporulation protein YlmC with PRC-barrel domain
MKKESLRLAAIALCVSAMCGTAFAADNSENNSSSTSASSSEKSSANNQNEKAAKNMPGADSKVPLNLSRASKVIGTNVEDTSGKKIGDIKDVVVDRKTGQVAYAVVDFGGWLGMGDKYFAVPWKALKSGANDRYVLNTSKDALKKAQGFDKDHWPDMASESWNRENYEAFHEKPYWEESTASHHMHGSSAGSSKNAGSSSSGSSKQQGSSGSY